MRRCWKKKVFIANCAHCSDEMLHFSNKVLFELEIHYEPKKKKRSMKFLMERAFCTVVPVNHHATRFTFFVVFDAIHPCMGRKTTCLRRQR